MNIMNDFLFPDLDPIVALTILEYEQEKEEEETEEE